MLSWFKSVWLNHELFHVSFFLHFRLAGLKRKGLDLEKNPNQNFWNLGTSDFNY